MNNKKIITIGESTTKKALMQLLDMEDKGLLDGIIVSAFMAGGEIVTTNQDVTIPEQYMLIGYLQSDAVIRQLSANQIVD